jgi:hypothetical protein
MVNTTNLILTVLDTGRSQGKSESSGNLTGNAAHQSRGENGLVAFKCADSALFRMTYF